MQYAEELNDLQDATLEAISAARDEVEAQFSEHAENDSLVDHTLKRLLAYASDRSQAVSYLVSSDYVWDAEMILRSFYEASAKVWFLCLAKSDERNALAKEFWGPYAEMHNHKRINRAGPATELFQGLGRSADRDVFAVLRKPSLFDPGEGNKVIRRGLEQKWSFTEIVKTLADNAPADFDFRDAKALLHMFGQQSHLVHADDVALDLMLDRKLRSPDELELLACAHVARIFSDQVSLWMISAMALRYRYGRKSDFQGDLLGKSARVHGLGQPIQDRFYRSQEEFYERVLGDS